MDGIDLQGAGELVEGAGDVSALAEDAAAVDVLGGGLEAHAVEARLVAHVLGGLIVGLEVVLVGGVVVFAEFGGLAALVPAGGALGVRGWTKAGPASRTRSEGEERR